jgi:hypothetical protein
MDSLMKTLIEQASAFTSSADILRYVPQFVAAAQSLTVPGIEKRTIVIKGLHDFAAALAEAGHIQKEVQAAVDELIDLAAPVAIDAILDVARGKVSFTGEPTATETATATATATTDKIPAVEKVAVKGVNCLLYILKTLFKKK